ncbi:MAG: transketolase [Planctomycetes bacterium RBG_16_64_10]|nr:MAG: transketolase [Planctomycetes bacterium RBG_16_64_10]
MSISSPSMEELAINTVRTLAIDAVQAAGSGHPGTPMALAGVAYTLWNDVLRYDPADPLWPARDRFVLSCGHASMLLYALIHLAGVRHVGPDGRPTDQPALPLAELKDFRQWNSRTAGHPEYGLTTGVETTTGPLGQGCGASVGMAIAQRWLATHFNRPGFDLFDYHIYVLCSDGDLMEGVGCEAASLAGHLRLPNLCWIYDDNRITIEGRTELAFSEDVPARFAGLGWHVVQVDDANDRAALARAYDAFLQHRAGPTLIVVRSHIGYGAPNKQDTADAHGAPLGDEEVRLTKLAYGWPADQQFLVPDGVLAHFQRGIGQRGRTLHEAWLARYADYARAYPDLAAQLDQIQRRRLPHGWDADLPVFEPDGKGVASRVSAGKVLNAIARKVPWLLGGAADLAPSTKTLLTFDGADHFLPHHHAGRNLHFGVREHAMAAAINGMTLAGLRAYGATFFVFSDYLRPAMRLAAMMHLPSIFIFTHDSIGVGEDGPTHQPVEQLAAARTIPGLVVLRPADANETAEAWRVIMALTARPAALVLSRQDLPTLDRQTCAPAAGVAHGAYILAREESPTPDVILIGTGSEVALCLEARARLEREGIGTRVISMPSWELFDQQDQDYRDRVLPPELVARVAVEAGIRQGWDRYVGSAGRFVGIDRFGASAPYQDVYQGLGLTVDAVVAQAKSAMRRPHGP